MVGPKKQEFWPRINILKENLFFFKLLMNYGSSKSAKIIHSKSILNVKNQLKFFKRNLGLGQIFWPKIRWRKPKLINEKLQLRPINQLIGRPLMCIQPNIDFLCQKSVYSIFISNLASKKNLRLK